MKKLAILIFAVLLGFSAGAQNAKQSNTATTKTATTTTIQKVVIQTNGVCSKCEALFKENVPFFKGVKDYNRQSRPHTITLPDDKLPCSEAVLWQLPNPSP